MQSRQIKEPYFMHKYQQNQQMQYRQYQQRLQYQPQLQNDSAAAAVVIASPDEELIELPLPTDVLLGKGKPIQGHAGNLRLQAIVESYVVKYESYDRKQHHASAILSTSIVQQIKESSGRFLSKESGIWKIVDDLTAREKVSCLFRTRKKKNGKQRK